MVSCLAAKQAMRGLEPTHPGFTSGLPRVGKRLQRIAGRSARRRAAGGRLACHSYFPATPLEFSCSVIHLSASYSVIKPLISSVSPSGHRISTPQPDPGFFRATKVGRCSDIHRICAYGGPVQASYPATIKLTTTPIVESPVWTKIPMGAQLFLVLC